MASTMILLSLAVLALQFVQFAGLQAEAGVSALPAWGRFRVDLFADGAGVAVQAVGLSEEMAESPAPPVAGRLDGVSPSLRDLCRWIHQHLPLRAPPPEVCVEAGCRCEDEPLLLELAASVDRRAWPDVKSCRHVADGPGICATALGKYCPRSCGLCRAGEVLETTRKRPELPSDFCSDRHRPPWAWLTKADLAPVSAMPAAPASLFVLELGTWTYAPVAIGHAPLQGFKSASLAPAVFEASEPLLSPGERQEIMRLAESQLSDGTVESFGSGESSGHSSRTSTVAWLAPEDGPAVQKVFDVGRRLLRARQNQFERLQVVRYLPGQFYQQHVDYFEYWKYPEHSKVRDGIFKRTKKGSANRVATLLWYLSEGSTGTTSFPLADGGNNGAPVAFDECGERGVSVSPASATAVLFYSQLPNGTLDGRSIHAGCPPRSGETKWAANLWLWNTDISEFSERESSADPLAPSPPNLSHRPERLEV